MRELTYRAFFPFGGSGAGALGFQDAQAHLPGFDVTARFEVVGGFDIDAQACADFQYLTGVEQLCIDARALTPAMLRRAAGKRAPDCVFTSAPCQGSSGLLSAEKAKSEKYQSLNELALIWVRLMLATWDEPPALMLFENVPRIQARAAEMLSTMKRLLRAAGYVLTDGHHDCGELGGLAQHRRRWLLVARHPRRCPPLLYQPPKRRVRGCGEVLGNLPVPGSIDARAFGRMHEMPRLSWLNWVRLALIPAGGDWRDLEGVLAEGQARREEFKRHAVEAWHEPVGTVAGVGNNGVANVADPRIDWFKGILGVNAWDVAAPTVTTSSSPSNGRYSVADPRVKRAFDAGYAVLDWRAAARTIATKTSAGCGAYAVADPRSVVPTERVWEGDPRKPPDFTPVIVASDGTWHRPLTTLELAALQGFPMQVRGEPLKLAGSNSRIRTAIGNAVPPPAAHAIAERMLIALAEGALGAFSMSSETVWVTPEKHAEERHG